LLSDDERALRETPRIEDRRLGWLYDQIRNSTMSIVR